MKTLIRLIKWDFTLQLRYNIVTIAIIISALYILLFKSLPGDNLDPLLILLILSDPAMFGVMFIGVLVLYEKDNNTLDALIVTPLKSSQYLWSKAISLTLIAVPIALAIAIIGHGFDLNYFYFIVGLALSSIMFVFLGFAVVSKANGFNQYIIKFALCTIPVSIPVLGIFDLYQSNIYYLIPSHATILLLKAGLKHSIANWQVFYSTFYLLFWLILCFILASRAYQTNLTKGK